MLLRYKPENGLSKSNSTRASAPPTYRSEEHTSELQSRQYLHSFPTRRSSDLSLQTRLQLHQALGKRFREVYAIQRKSTPLEAYVVGFPTGVAVGPCCYDTNPRTGSPRVTRPVPQPRLPTDRKSTRLNSSHANIYTLSLHDALPIYLSRHVYNSIKPSGNGSGKYTRFNVNLHRSRRTSWASPPA